MFDFTVILIPALVGVGYWAIGYIEKLIVSPSEPFDLQRTIRTLGSGVVIGFLQAVVGTAIDPSLVTSTPALWALAVVALNKVLNMYSAAPAAAPPAGGSAAAAAGPAGIPATGPTGQPVGQVDVLGIYGHSAYHDQPADTATFNVNQVPRLFFNVLVRKPGKVMFGILYDGMPLHNYDEFGEDFENVLDMRPIAFLTSKTNWMPGTHKITIKTGHDIEHGTAWDEFVEFTLVLTGVPAQE
jgi:hypothetical protein